MSLFKNIEFDGHEQVSFFHEKSSGLKAIIAIHNSSMGSICGGGIRMRQYNNEDEALTDVLRLSRGMTYKSAMAGLPLGGAKSVIIGDPSNDKTPAMLEAMGHAIESFAGRYVAGEDVGTNSADMDAIGRVTKYVSTSEGPNTAPYTARGVYLSMLAAVKAVYGKSSLFGMTVALQGAGEVAQTLARILVDEGAKIQVADINETALEALRDLPGVTVVGVDEIMTVDADIFSPCALGGILNEQTISRLKANIVCGAANNQLATEADDLRLYESNILYMPDYVVNAGGVIAAAAKLQGITEHEQLEEKVSRIYESAEAVIKLSRGELIPMQEAADKIAKDIIYSKKENK